MLWQTAQEIPSSAPGLDRSSWKMFFEPEKSEILARSVGLLTAQPPSWDTKGGQIDMIYWYFGTEALFAVGGKPWKAWDAKLREAVLRHQRRDTNPCLYAGSWDPCGPWGSYGGRVYSTALLAMCLEVYYRQHVFWDTE